MIGAIRVLVVDDSLIIRKLVTEALSHDPEIQVVGVAMDGDFALMKMHNLGVDVVVLDINMPRLDGFEVLKVLNDQYHIPTIIFSSFTREGAFITLQALKYGATDFICKPNEGSVTDNKNYVEKVLVEKIKAVHHAYNKKTNDRLRTQRRSTFHEEKSATQKIDRDKLVAEGGLSTKQAAATSVPVNAESEHSRQELCESGTGYPLSLPPIVVIGASTGGVMALDKILKGLPADFPAGIVVVQHMPKEFTGAFAETMDQNLALRVVEASGGQVVMPGYIYIAPGDLHLRIRRVASQFYIALDSDEFVNGHRPSVDVFFHSVALAAGPKAIAVILTGMGKDGAAGIEAIKRTGGWTMAQDEQSCVVFGMPREAIKTGAIDQVVPLLDIAARLTSQTQRLCNCATHHVII
jgi:two-component system chemotaxis response regulator CheB